jgi:hypothetical protein
MKRYLLSIYQPDGGTLPPEDLAKVMRDVNALVEETKAAGAWVFNGGLHAPSTATVPWLRDGEVLTTDGLFAEGKEQWRVRDRQGAGSRRRAEWGRKLARDHAPIEVRPFRTGDALIDVERSPARSTPRGGPRAPS